MAVKLARRQRRKAQRLLLGLPKQVMPVELRRVAEDSEAVSHVRRATSFYSLTSADIKAQWADALFRKDDSALADARKRVEAWNRNNPDMPIVIKIPDMWKRAREMAKPREERVLNNTPKAIRQQMREFAARE